MYKRQAQRSVVRRLAAAFRVKSGLVQYNGKLPAVQRGARKYFCAELREVGLIVVKLFRPVHASLQSVLMLCITPVSYTHLKSLVYFSTSLKGNELVLEKLLRMDFVRDFPDDTELLEDVIIENKQAIEMSNIYRDILSGTMDAFASVISNNLNIVMKMLASVTIILTVPSLSLIHI